MLKKILSFLMVLSINTLLSNTIHVPYEETSIQGGILSANVGDTVLVAPGVYYENINFRGKDIVVASQYILTNNEIDINSTIINGSTPIHQDTASCVLFISGESQAAVLAGFTLTGGTGTRWVDEHGYGTYYEGGGILIALSSPTIIHNKIVGNEAIRVDAGITSSGGGGIRCGDGSPVIMYNHIDSNVGMYGAGIVMNFASGIIRNNLITNNQVYQATQGIQTFGGGGIWVYGQGDQTIIENNTIVGNSSNSYGGGIRIWDTDATLRNNIIWYNNQLSDSPVNITNSNVDIRYNAIEFGWEGSGNIDSLPLFCNPDSGDYTLADNSPCLGTGENGINMGYTGIGDCGMQAFIVDIWIDTIYVNPNTNDLLISAELENPDQGPQTVYAEIYSLVDSWTDTIALADDGLHEDGQASDDFWGMNWSPPEFERTYFIRIFTVNEVSGFVFRSNKTLFFTTVGPIVFDGITAITDTIAEPGDFVSLQFALKNLGSNGIAESITAELSSNDTCFTSIVISGTFGNIEPGESNIIFGGAGFRISDECSGDVNLPITIDIYSDGYHFWTDSFMVYINESLGINADDGLLPKEFTLHQNYPNPFNPVTTLRYDLSENSFVSITIYDLLGRKVTTLVSETQTAGFKSVIWNATNDQGRPVSAGVYFYQIQAGEFMQTKKMVLLK